MCSSINIFVYSIVVVKWLCHKQGIIITCVADNPRARRGVSIKPGSILDGGRTRAFSSDCTKSAISEEKMIHSEKVKSDDK